MDMKKKLKAAGLAAILVASVVPQANAGLIAVVTDTNNCYKVEGPRSIVNGDPSGIIDMCIGDGIAVFNISSGLNISEMYVPVFDEFDLNDLNLVTSAGVWSEDISDFGTKYLNFSGPLNQEIKNTTFELRSDDFDFNFGSENSAVIFNNKSEGELYSLPTLGYAPKQQTPVPEPSTLAIFALGMIGLASRRFKKQS